MTDLSVSDNKYSVFALGIFDGLHIAHEKIISSSVAYAQQHGFTPAVFTIKGSPKDDLRLISQDIFISRVVDMGVKQIVSPNFDDIKDISASEFFFCLKEKYNVKAFFCGYNFKFGKDVRGDCRLLEKLCLQNDVKCFILPKYELDGLPVSSSRIRGCLLNGDAQVAAKLLGRPFSYNFQVVVGNKIGRLMNTPTINQVFPDDFCVPKYGVYASYARVDGRTYCAVTNIGVKPTVGAEKPLSETWIADFSGDLYGKNIEVGILKFLRPEKKFESLEELRSAILDDAEKARMIMRDMIEEIK